MTSPYDSLQFLEVLSSLDFGAFPEELYLLHYTKTDRYLGYYSPEGGVSGIVCFSEPQFAQSFLQYAEDKSAEIIKVSIDEAREIAKDPRHPKVEALLLADDPWRPKVLYVRAEHETIT